MAKPIDPVQKRIPDVPTAKRCIASVMQYLREHESPLAAEDLKYSIKLLLGESRLRGRAAREHEETKNKGE